MPNSDVTSDPFSVEWHPERCGSWRQLERKYASLIIMFSGSAFAIVLDLIFTPAGGALLPMLCGAMLWFGAVMICLSADSVRRCQDWQNWHAEMLKDPVAWPWPLMPGER